MAGSSEEDSVLALTDLESFFFLYNCLWSPNPNVQRCHLNIPDVILFQDGRPHRWLFTSDIEGDVLKKKNDRLAMVPVLVKSFKNRSSILRNGKLNKHPGKIATLWINSMTGIISALLTEIELANLLHTIAIGDGPNFTEIMALQVYYGGGHSANPALGSGLFEHRVYARRNPNAIANPEKLHTGFLGKHHESFEHAAVDRFGRQVLSTYSKHVDRVDVGEGQNSILTSMSNVVIDTIERAHRVRVSNLVLQVSFTANWIPVLVAVRSVLLYNIDAHYLNSKSKKHALIYPIESLPTERDLFFLSEVLPRATFEFPISDKEAISAMMTSEKEKEKEKQQSPPSQSHKNENLEYSS